jgi:outer membrane protein OmpA-like peptidoglycan-associated protein
MKTITLVFLLIAAFIGVSAQETQKFTVYFNPTLYAIDSKAASVLDSVVRFCETSKAKITSISGFCDSIGTIEENNILSERRAAAVKLFLSTKKVSSDSATISGKGETNEFNGINFYQNRRVEIIASIPAKKTNLEEKITRAKVGDLIVLENISFYNNLEIPLPQSIPVMEELYTIMLNNPNLEIAIEGHICCQPVDIDNLSEMRAKTVYDFLVKKGIAANRMSYKGFGHTRPLNQELTNEEKQLNRRVEIRVLKNQ